VGKRFGFQLNSEPLRRRDAEMDAEKRVMADGIKPWVGKSRHYVLLV
jgi:hypothetical protein